MELICRAAVSFELEDVVYRGLRNVRESLFGQECLVRGNYDVRHRDESCKGVVLEDVSREVLKEEVRLLLVNVKASRADLS